MIPATLRVPSHSAQMSAPVSLRKNEVVRVGWYTVISLSMRSSR